MASITPMNGQAPRLEPSGFAAQLRRAVMPPDILELQEEINDLRRRRREHYVRLFEMPPLSGCFELEVEPASHGAVLG